MQKDAGYLLCNAWKLQLIICKTREYPYIVWLMDEEIDNELWSRVHKDIPLLLPDICGLLRCFAAPAIIRKTEAYHM